MRCRQLINIDWDVLTGMVSEQYKGKDALIKPNVHALEIGRNYALDYLDNPLPIQLRRSNVVGDKIMIEGNTASALGAVYGGATVCAWYPITPSTSVAESFERYANRFRIDKETGKKKFAIMQAEDELAAIGMVIGAAWNGARAFTATSGPGLSLMGEFLGLAYFAEIPAVLIDVQRAGPSTGMPTRTQQADLMSAVYASHGDTKHVVLIPSSPKECFDFSADALDIADRLQTPVIIMSDLELGMNEVMSDPLVWDDARKYDRGKVYHAEDLDRIEKFGRYVDVDGDGIGYRTYPGAHPSKGRFFTRGTSRDEYARYTEDPDIYTENMDRLLVRSGRPRRRWCPSRRSTRARRGAVRHSVLRHHADADAGITGPARDRWHSSRLTADSGGAVHRRGDRVHRESRTRVHRRTESRRPDADDSGQRRQRRSGASRTRLLLRRNVDCGRVHPR